MAKLEDLVVNLRGDVSNLQASLKQAQGQINAFAGRTEAELRGVKAATAGVGNAFKSLGGIVGTYLGVETLRSISNASMQMDALNNRMNAAVGAGENAANSLKFIREEADRLGLVFSDSASAFAGFAASATRSGLTLEQSQNIFRGVAEAATAMKLSVADQSLVFKALEQMAAKGVVSMEELRGQLGERLPGAVQMFASSLGVTNAEFMTMVQNGEVGVDALIKFGDALHAEFGQAAIDASTTAAAAMNRFKTSVFDLQVQLGQSTGGISAYRDALDGLSNFINSEFVDGTISTLKVAILGLRATWEAVISGIGTAFALFVNRIKQDLNKLIEAFNRVKQVSNDLLNTNFAMTEAFETQKASEIISQSWDNVGERLKKLNDEYTRTAESAAKLQGVSGVANPVGNKTTGNLPSVVKASSDEVKSLGRTVEEVSSIIDTSMLRNVRSFEDLKDVALDALQSIGESMLENIWNNMGSGFLGGITSGIGNFFGGLFGRATGGPVSPNVPYVVGERGPELFVPSVGGQVMNKNQVGGVSSSQPVTVIQNISIGTSVGPAVRQEVMRMMPELKQMSISAVEDARFRGAMI